MTQHLSDAGRVLRGLNRLTRQIFNEASKSSDSRRRTSSPLAPIGGIVSSGLDRLGNVNISDTIVKTAWKSSTLIQQTGIALTAALRTPIKTEIPHTTPVEDKIPIPTHAEISSSTVTTTTPSPPPVAIQFTTVEPIYSPKSAPITLDPIPFTNPANQTPKQSSTTIGPTFFTPSINETPHKTPIESTTDLHLKAPPLPTNDEGQARAVPTTRFGRLASFGSLAAGLGIGAMGQFVRRSVGLEEASSSKALLSPYLSKANAERIVDTLCKVRGAALKLGQMISIQDNFLVQDDIQKIFERVRQKADFMPEWQMNEVMTKDFGTNWRDQFQEFHDRPFAAASIGQVHYGILLDGRRRVAVKIQYPGVGKSIESDINNLVSLLNFWNIIPRGLYIESVIKVAKRELNWEVDYIREAEWGRRFQNWLINYPIYRIPNIIDELSSKNVLTTTYFDGITLDCAVDQDQSTRDQIGTAILELCLLELFKFKAMQTDPNWSNFLFDPISKTIGLIDFGSSREFSSTFIENYIQIIRAAADNDRERVGQLSIQGNFLTGHETRDMRQAHIDAVMVLGEGFRTSEAFDFGLQNTTHKIHKLLPVMLKHRLTPPPEDSYSLHRKMAGAFLLCSKLRSRVYCQPIFERIWQMYQNDRRQQQQHMQL